MGFVTERSADMPVKPFVKWAGGKSQILDSIRNKYPDGIGTKITKYAEPFVGGGAVLFDILSRYNMDEVYISDINRELIQTYFSIRDNIDDLICSLQTLERQYLDVNDAKRKEIYYAVRERFNALKVANDESVEISALFVFLNRTCFNGLYRVNSHGAFNVPQGSYKNPTICDERNLRAVSEKLQGVTIVCGDYRESKSFIDGKTLAYFDPPCVEAGFGDKEHTELAKFADDMSARNAWIIATVADNCSANNNNSFFDKLYNGYEKTTLGVNRMVNSKKGWKEIGTFLINNKGYCL